MENILRTLIYDGQVSLTLIDSTETVCEGIRLHGLSRPAAAVFGKLLTVMTYMSACLKEETGKISVSVKGNGATGNISVSGNYALQIRGSIENAEIALLENESEADAEKRCFGTEGTLSVIRDDGYSRPFVGACELSAEGEPDRAFEEYYRISEQLPTYVSSVVRLTEDGKCGFAGAAVLQPLPFADAETLKNLPLGEKLSEIAEAVGTLGLEKCAERYFSAKTADIELREAAYKCNCSKEYLSGVLVSLGYDQLDGILREDGAVRVHCHYCNKDYSFLREDIEELFRGEEKKRKGD